MRETVFGFPDQIKKPDLYRKWVRFINRQSWVPTNNSGICAKHFDPKFVKISERKTLKWELNPVPNYYCSDTDIPPSLLPTPETSRKPPTDRSQSDELKSFCSEDEIKCFSDITDVLCPPGYRLELQVQEDRAIFYKLEKTLHDIPEVTETIVIDKNLHVKLFKKSLPIPLPEWFRKGGDCCVKRKSILENFPPYIRNIREMDDIPDVCKMNPEKMQWMVSKKDKGRNRKWDNSNIHQLMFPIFLYFNFCVYVMTVVPSKTLQSSF